MVVELPVDDSPLDVSSELEVLSEDSSLLEASSELEELLDDSSELLSELGTSLEELSEVDSLLEEPPLLEELDSDALSPEDELELSDEVLSLSEALEVEELSPPHEIKEKAANDRTKSEFIFFIIIPLSLMGGLDQFLDLIQLYKISQINHQDFLQTFK